MKTVENMKKNFEETDKLYRSLFLNTPFVDDLIFAFARNGNEFIDGSRFKTDFLHRGSRHQKCRRFYDWLLYVYPRDKLSSDFNRKQEVIWKNFHNSGNASALEILQLIIAQQEKEGTEVLAVSQARHDPFDGGDGARGSIDSMQSSSDIISGRQSRIHDNGNRMFSDSLKLQENVTWEKSNIFVFTDACRAARVGDIDKLTEQVNACEHSDFRPITETDWSSKTLLHNVVDQGLKHPNQLICIDVLLDFAEKHRMKNDLLDAKDLLNGETALHLAIKRESVVLCKKLLCEGADYLIRNHNGESCLELLYEKLPQMIVFLLNKSVTTNGDTTGDLFDLSIDLGIVIGFEDRIHILEDDKSLAGEEQKFSTGEECPQPMLSSINVSRNANQRKYSRNSEEKLPLNVLPQSDESNAERLENAKYPIVEKSLRKIVDTKKIKKISYIGEMGMLANLVYTNPTSYPIILSHPVVKVFLDLKWKTMQSMLRISIFLHICFCILFMWVVYDIYLLKCPHSKKDPCEWSATDCSIVTMVLISNTIFFLKELFEARRLAKIQSVTTYFQGKENCVQLIFIALVYTVTIPVYYQNEFYRIQYGIAASAILLASIVILLVIGNANQSYIFHSAYVHVYGVILKRFLTVLTTFSAVIIAFALSFSIIFGETIPSFTTLDGSLGKMFIMLAGEFSFDEIFQSKETAAEKSRVLVVLAQILFIFFATFVTIILIDVFLGYTISDIQDLKNRSEVIWRSIQVEQLYIMEGFFKSLKRVIQFISSDSKLLKLIDSRVVIPQRKTMQLSTMQIELTSFSVLIPFKDINPLMRNDFRKILDNE